MCPSESILIECFCGYIVQQVHSQTTGCSGSVEHGHYIIAHYIADGKTISTSGEDCG